MTTDTTRRLLEALQAASDWIDQQIGVPRIEIQTLVQEAIAEAGTIATETRLSPRELAEQREELLEVLRYAKMDLQGLLVVRHI